MTLDEQMLKKAQREAARFAESERAALLARADYHTAVRRLHLAGGSLREIAEALGISAGVARTRMFRAVRLLRKRLQRSGVHP